MHQPPPTSWYGTDRHGLICGYLFQADGTVQTVDAQAAADWLTTQAAAPSAEDAPGDPAAQPFVWLHFNLSNAAAQPWLRAHAGLDDTFYEAFDKGSRSSRIERDGDSLFAVVNDVTFDFSFEASDVATLWASVRRHAVITARRHPLRAIDRLRAAVNKGEALRAPVALLDHLLRDQADELQRIARTATERVDDIEDELLAGKAERHGAELARLRRLAVRLQRLLAPEPAALLRVLANPPGWMSAHDTDQLHRASEEFAVVMRDVGSLQERIKLLQDESSARVAEQNNRSLFFLTMVTVLALPINLVAGLLGMNVGGLPLANHPHGFWWVVALVAVFTLAIAAYAVRRLAPPAGPRR